MQIMIPYVFIVTGRVRGTRRVDRTVVGNRRLFEIDEISPDDASVAVSWTSTVSRPSFADHIVGKDGVVEVRHREGRFYRPLNMIQRGFRVPLPPVEYATGGRIIDYGKILSDDVSQQLWTFARGTALPMPDMTGEIISLEDEVVAAHEAALANIVLIDGAIWQACPEPVLYFDEHPSDATGHVLAEFPDEHRWKGTTQDYVFQITEHEQAKWFSARRARDRGMEDSSIDARLEVTVFQENAFSRYDPGVEMVRHARRFVEEAGKLRFNERSADYASTWAEFRRACEKAYLTPDDPEIEAMLDAWDAFSRTSIADRTAETGKEIDSRKDHCANVLASFNALWERRPVAIEDVKFGMRR